MTGQALERMFNIYLIGVFELTGIAVYLTIIYPHAAVSLFASCLVVIVGIIGFAFALLASSYEKDDNKTGDSDE